MNATPFELIERRPIASLNIECQSYLHRRTGARHYHLASDDTNNAFMVVFPTPPENSTGVAHILEHTTLCGSRRYPVRDPFFMMLRRSLNTFMNAFTSSDSTAYPFATQNRKDFDNLLAVYLDAVFFPTLDALDFAQEGCRVEFSAPQDPAAGLVYKGVVYNEMKGAMSAPVSRLYHDLHAGLFPTTPYRYNSGGDPAAIPDLTYDDLKRFHARHYHPSQAVFMTYGSFPAQDHQALIEACALRHFDDGAAAPIVSAAEPPLAAPVAHDVTYPVDDSEGCAAATHAVWGWLVGEAADPQAMLEAHVLAGVLLEHSASPLRQFLETTPLAQAPSELCGIDDSARQLVFCCGVEGTEPEHAAELEAGVIGVLEGIVRDGVPAATLTAVLDRLEMAQRDIGGNGYPYGLQLMGRALPGAMYRRDPVALLDIDARLKDLRERAGDPAFVPRLVAARLLGNGHRARIVMRPDPAQREREAAAEAARLAQLQATLDAEAAARIAAEAAALAARQGSVQDADILPKVTLGDVPAALPPVVGHERRAGPHPVHVYARGTNGLVHAQIAFAFPASAPEDLAILPLFADYLTELGAGRASYLETQTRRARLGQFGATLAIRSALGDLGRSTGDFVISVKGLERHLAPLIEEAFAVLGATRFDELKRLRELLAQTRADLEASITDRGHQLAMHGAARGLSPAGWLHDHWDGPDHIAAIQALEAAAKDEDAALEALAARFAALRDRLLAAPYDVLFVGEDAVTAAAAAAIARAPAPGRAGGFAPFVPPAPPAVDRGAWLANSTVSFCARAFPAVPEGHADAPLLAILARYLQDGYLHPAIREQGGAYGGGAIYDADSGVFSLYSYRDPRLAETFLDFDGALGWLERHLEQARLEESILGVIRTLDKPRSPAGAAIHAFYSARQGRTHAFRSAFRDRVLHADLDALIAAARCHLVPARAVDGVVTGHAQRATIEALGFAVHTL